VSEALKSPLTSPEACETASPRNSRVGLLYGLSAYVAWGFFPLYFRAVDSVSPLVVLCHRMLWSALFLGVVVSIRGDWPAIGPAFRSRRSVLLLSAGAVLIALNWFLFILAVARRQVLQASLGYFINPLLSIALGVIFLRERLRAWQWLAVSIAAAAVLNLAWGADGFPWLGVALALTFGLYGLVRKKVDANSLHALMIETALLLPVSLTLLVALPAHRPTAATWALLSLSGLVTSIPLLMFGAALRRLPLSTVGFLQYVGPTLQFLVATCLFHEPLDRPKLVSFALCWLAICVYIADSLISRRPLVVADEPD